jgi:hypothetical protein
MSNREVHVILRNWLASFAIAASCLLSLVGSESAAASSVAPATPMPVQVFSPYFETWTSDAISRVAHQSGARYFTLAFLETLGKHSCQLAWNGDPSAGIDSDRYVDDIARLRALGGDVTPSFGGWSADQGGTEIGDSCASVDRIAHAYEKVIRTYGVSRLDMDIEGNSLNRAAGIDRRNKAIAMVQHWAIANGRPLTISFTLPTARDGLESDGLSVLQNAVMNGVRIDIVQPMVFDYYDGVDRDMADSAIGALRALHAQLASLLPRRTSAELWSREGATIMIGRDDYPTKIETTTVADARRLRNFAESKFMAVLSMWAIQRDNGSCPGKPGLDDCSGIAQRPWAFTGVLERFTSPGRVPERRVAS